MIAPYYMRVVLLNPGTDTLKPAAQMVGMPNLAYCMEMAKGVTDLTDGKQAGFCIARKDLPPGWTQAPR